MGVADALTTIDGKKTAVDPRWRELAARAYYPKSL